MQQRRDEILAKKAKLAELKRQREIRASQASAGRQNLGGGDLISPTPSRADNRREIEYLINSLVGESRPGSTTTGGAASPGGPRASRPNSVLSAGELSNEASESAAASVAAPPPPQLSTAPLTTVYECPPSPVKEVFSYSKGVQTSDEWPSPARNRAQSTVSDSDDLTTGTTNSPNKRQSRRERDREEQLRQKIREEVEAELRAAKESLADGTSTAPPAASANYPSRELTAEELEAVTRSEAFVDFLEQSTKVIERAIDHETYDILTDYALQGKDQDDDDEESGNSGGRGSHRIKEVVQFFDDRWSKKRMISGIDFSPKFSELLLASYTKNPTAPHEPDGIVQVWNTHMHNRPEYVFTAQSDILTAKFSPYHPNLIIGGSYSGQVLLWDTRAKAAPVQKTPLTGYGHAHPIYSVDIVGTQNANNIISCSTDGVVCGWSMDVFAQPQELLELKNPSQAKVAVEDVSPTCVSFPQTDPTFFLVGSEEGTIFPCHRYDRAGAKAGVDKKISYKGHTAPVMSVDFHPSRGPIDLGDLIISSSLDWSVKLWKVRAPAATSTVGAGDGSVAPLIDFVREDVVYDARWSPVKPSVFALVDGAGWLELWDIAVETEEPTSRISPSQRQDGRTMLSKSLNKLAWEPNDGKRLATGGIDGSLTVFEVGSGFGGKEGLKSEEWTSVKKLVNRVEAVGLNGAFIV
ncbi:cytoplasmic dynein 1 intermediate chain 2 [Metarhizium album ARSEF 1941]|uniref:Cytoplasmic dynein 1 intermediate chain 2 n=1 Tax=Metarhizium album (strain ARSEF 1941) TaxID=1081103 RepID=A0A0B2X3U7_METAS|nr:cytoplasmic dynein 1 intermediate chain 2 [Metarhizium album ARSEF 1941]KHO00105.1 cytoplasmic dynein 1 intermediate chain 2 [Metarhizium album ARSEF 1941]